MAKIVVTGGCGYIGSHIVRSLKKHNPNDQVFVIDCVRREHTLKGLNGYLIDDIASKQSLLWLEKLEPDVIIHCAGSSLVEESGLDPAIYYENNIAKTSKLLSYVKNFPRKPLILFSSSASVYGNQSSVPIMESDEKKPISTYGYTKLVIEQMLHDYHKAYGLPSICFRYFNAAGADPFHYTLGQAPGATHIIARILEAKLHNRPFTLNGADYDTPDHTCVRDYVHVWDIADAHIKAIAWVRTMEEKSAWVMNLGTQKGISNQEIIDYITITYNGLDVLIGPRRAGDPDILVANSDMARKLLKWEPTYSTVDQIVDSAYKWYTNWYEMQDNV